MQVKSKLLQLTIQYEAKEFSYRLTVSLANSFPE